MTKIILKKPVKVDDFDVSEVSVKEPTGRQIKEAQQKGGTFTTIAQQTDYQHSLIASCVSLPVKTVENMLQSDLNKIWVEIENFFQEEEKEKPSS